MSEPSPRVRRRWFTVAAVVAAGVAVVFSTVGDGVEVPDATGARRVVVDLGHQIVWALLAGSFAIAAIRGRWSAASQVPAVAAGAVYALFLFAVFLWP